MKAVKPETISKLDSKISAIAAGSATSYHAVASAINDFRERPADVLLDAVDRVVDRVLSEAPEEDKSTVAVSTATESPVHVPARSHFSATYNRVTVRLSHRTRTFFTVLVDRLPPSLVNMFTTIRSLSFWPFSTSGNKTESSVATTTTTSAADKTSTLYSSLDHLIQHATATAASLQEQYAPRQLLQRLEALRETIQARRHALRPQVASVVLRVHETVLALAATVKTPQSVRAAVPDSAVQLIAAADKALVDALRAAGGKIPGEEEEQQPQQQEQEQQPQQQEQEQQEAQDQDETVNVSSATNASINKSFSFDETRDGAMVDPEFD